MTWQQLGTIASREAKRQQTAAIIEDLEWLIGAGVTGHELARRVGYENPCSLIRRLRRAGRHDLAARLGISEWRLNHRRAA